MFGVFSAFFGGFVVLHVSWFGITGSYDGVKPNTYAPTGSAGSQLNDLQGLWISSEQKNWAILKVLEPKLTS